jgi:C-terminal processing protease CtpA/Prc
MSRVRRAFAFSTLACVAVGGLVAAAPRSPQGINANDLYLVRTMLHDAYDSVKSHYYDPKFHGLDWDGRFKEYDDKMKTAASLNAGVAIVAAFLGGLNDSHTYFSPPRRPYRHDYGYRVNFIGDDAMVTRVRPGTDAEGKVKPGDRVMSLNGNAVTRETFFSMEYFLNVLSPQAATKLMLRDPASAEREALVNAKVLPTRQLRDLTGSGADVDLADLIKEMEATDHIIRQQYAEMGDVMIWKMPTFNIEPSEVDKLMATARKHAALILDLRGNGGGRVDAMSRMLGSVFDHDVAIGDRVARKDTKKLMAKTRGGNAFPGKLVVITDSGSASAAEIFPKVVQLEGRGTIIGDRSAGAVMEAIGYPFAQGSTVVVFYAFSVTDADLIMKDGKSLERLGVTPDEKALPTAQDLASGRDPVLARAAQLVGLALDPIAAGKLFPFEWRPF